MKRLNLLGINLFIQIKSMRKLLFSLVIICNALLVQAQWTTFNKVHPVSCQMPPFNYVASGYFENVFILDTVGSYLDGYSIFGRGFLFNAIENANYSRCFSSRVNVDGDLLWWNRLDSIGPDSSSQWYAKSPNYGGMCLNHNREVVSALTVYPVNDPTGYYGVDYLTTSNLFGDIISRRIIDSSYARFRFQDIIQDVSDSAYIISGGYQDSLAVVNNDLIRGITMKIGQNGVVIWMESYDDTFMVDHVIQALDGGFWVFAESYYSTLCSDGENYNTNIILIKTDENGTEEGRIELGGECSKERASLIEFEIDKVVLVGRLTNAWNAESYVYDGYYFSSLIEQSSNGQLLETTSPKKYLNTIAGNFVDLHKTDSGNLLIVCDNYLSPAQGSGLEYRSLGGILALNNERDSIWFRHYSYYNNFPTGGGTFPAIHLLYDSKLMSDQGVVCCGYIQQYIGDPNPLLKTPWVFKVDSMGCLEPGCQYVNVEEIVVGLENTITVFPNPANDVVNLSFTFPENYIPNNQNEIVIIDMQGREILRENIFLFATSSNTIEINISSLSSGMYTLHWLSNSAWLDSSKVIVE